MRLWNTYFIRSNERDYPGPKDTGIYRSDGSLIKMVPRAFITNGTRQDSGLCVEGSGVLDDGRVVNYSSSCNYGPVCLTGGQICYSVLDATRFPWGKGSHQNPLVPLRSLATCPSEIPYGTYVFIPQWRGVEIPRIGDIGGFVHDGCFRADDTGGWICPRAGDPPGVHHIDIFAGSMQMASALERIFPTRTQFDATGSTTSCMAAQTAPDTSNTGLILLGVGAASVVAYFGWKAYQEGRGRGRSRKNPSKLSPQQVAALGQWEAWAAMPAGDRYFAIHSVSVRELRRLLEANDPNGDYRDIPKYEAVELILEQIAREE